MEPGCPSGGGGYPLSGALGWGGRSGEGRRGNIVLGGGLSRSPAAAVRASLRLPAVGGTSGPGRQRPEPCSECVPTEKDHVKQSAESRL